MLRTTTIICAILTCLVHEESHAQGFASATNLYIESGAVLFVKDDFSNEAGGTVHNSGEIQVTGNFNNDGSAQIDETVVLNGSGSQLVTGNTIINDLLEVNKSSGTVTVSSGETGIFGQLRLANGQVNSNDRIVIKSEPSRTGLVDDFSNPAYVGSIVNDIRVQRWLEPVNPGTLTFHYIGSAVNSPNINELAPEIFVNGPNNEQLIPESDCNPDHLNAYSPYGRVLEWHEDGSWLVPGCTQSGWWVRSNGFLTNGRGYSVRATGVTLEIGGVANTSELSNVSYSGLQWTNATGNGWHLVSNPFPSPILWNLSNYNSINSLSGGSIAGGIAFWQATGPLSGTYQTFTPIQNVMVGSSQGFFVQVQPGPVFNWTLPQSVRSLGDPTFYKVDYSSTIELFVKGGGFADMTTIQFGENGETNDYDLVYDGLKIPSPGNHPTLSTRLGDYSYSINSLPYDGHPNTVPLDLIPGVSGAFSIEAESINEFNVESNVYLEDLKTGIIQNLTSKPHYQFHADESDDPERFLLHFVLGTEDDEILNADEDIIAFVYDGTATVYLPEQVRKSELEVFNMMGELVFSQSGLNQGKNTIELSGLSSGAYLMRVRMNKTWISKKVVL